jgi:hypothetical protein
MTRDTKKSRLRNIFRKKKPIKEEKQRIGIASLKKMVKTKEQEDILKKIELETIPTVRDAWIDYFLEIAKAKKIKSE